MESRPLQELSPLESKLSSLSCTACIQCTLCFLQFFLVGSAHSIGVFTVPVERYASPAHSLDGVWVASIGSISFMSALISLFVHYLLDALPVPSETYRVRALSAVSTLALLLFSVSAYGVYLQSIPIIAIFVGMYSVPLTIHYFVAFKQIFLWARDQAAPVIAIGQIFLGIGNIICAQVFHLFVTNHGVLRGILFSSLFVTAISLLPTIFQRPPNIGERTGIFDVNTDRHKEIVHPIEHVDRKLPWTALIRIPDFWYYVAASVTGAVPFCFIPYFFKLGLLFDIQMSELIHIYQIVEVVSTAARSLVVAWTGCFGVGKGYLFSGSRNLMLLLTGSEVLIFAILPTLTRASCFVAYIILQATGMVFMACCMSLSVLVAKDFFGPSNMNLAFIMGNGIALEIGTSMSVWAMSAVEAFARRSKGPEIEATDYNPFFILATLWSLIGFVLLLFMQRHPAIFTTNPLNKKSSCYNSC